MPIDPDPFAGSREIRRRLAAGCRRSARILIMAHILLIEDDDGVRDLLRVILTDRGHTVISTINGKEGLARFHEQRFDLVITDIVMPETEGFAVLLELRKAQPPVKIIAISGGGKVKAEDYLRTAKQLGASKVLAKPFSGQALLALVDGLLAAPDVHPA